MSKLVGSPKKEVQEKKETRKFRQFVRVRPFLEAEKNANRKNEKPEVTSDFSSVEVVNGEVRVMDPKSLTRPKQMAPSKAKKTYTGFDGVFWSFGEDPWKKEGREKDTLKYEEIDHTNIDNDGVYEAVKGDIVHNLFEGFNQTVIAYGAINSGKTYTMFGDGNVEGLTQKFVADILAAVPVQKQERQAPGEDLHITVEARAFRVYKEDIEDILKGEHLLKGDYPKLAHTETEKATIVKLHEEKGLLKFQNRIYAQKESIRRVSTMQGPNKANRSQVIVEVSVLQESRFEGGGDESVKAAKAATLYLVDYGFGGKAESESNADFKKINQAQGAFKQLMRAFGDRGESVNNTKYHIGTNSSNATRLLHRAVTESHVSLILGVSPWHKDQTETNTFLDTVAQHAAKGHSTAKLVQAAELGAFREQLQNKAEIERRVVEESSNITKVQQELMERQVAINQLTQDLADREEEEKQLIQDIADMEASVKEVAARLTSAKEARKIVLASLDKREAGAKEKLAEYNARIAELIELIAKYEAELEAKKKKVDEAYSLIQRVAGLRSLMTGEPIEKSDLKNITEDDIAKYSEQDSELFGERAAGAIESLNDVVAKYEKVAVMNDENGKIMADMQAVMEEYDAESQKVEEARLAFYRAQRKCIEEIVQSVHDVEDGPLAKMRRISKAEGRGDDTHKFFEAELKGITDVFGSESMKLKPAGWCGYSEVVPVMAWVNSLTSQEELNATAGSIGGPKKHVRYNVENVSNAEIDIVKKLVAETSSWAHLVLKHQGGRMAIESAHREWLAIMPVWPKNASEALVLGRALKETETKKQEVESELDSLLKDIEKNDGQLDQLRKKVQELTKQLAQKREELKKASEGCVIL